MLVPEVHQYGGTGTWLFYVIVPVVLCGVVACLWWIVKGAIGAFGRHAAKRLSTIPSTAGLSSETAVVKRALAYITPPAAARATTPPTFSAPPAK
jgi:hypothetical protein